MKQWAKKQSGFTIVELLIVVVVIAILAAITIVAYNGIQNRAKNSATQSAAAQISKKISVWQVTNADQIPADLATVGVSEASGSNYEYTSSSTSWCATVTTNGVSYFVSNASKNPKAGGCAGHAQNGTAVITNLIPNPSFESNNAQTNSIGSPTGRVVERLNGVSAYSGDYLMRATWATGGNLGGYGSITTDTLPNGEYVGSMWIRSNVASVLRPYLEGSAAKTAVTTPGVTTLVPDVWTRINYVFAITTPGTIRMSWLGQGTAAAGTYIDMDAVMITAGTTLYNFSDGSGNNWSWNGDTNNSTSKGIPV